MIIQHAGRDATAAFEEIHSKALLTNTLTTSKLMGIFDGSSAGIQPRDKATPQAPEVDTETPLNSILSCHDFEVAAQKKLSKKAWAYYSSAATDLVTVNANKSLYDRVWFRPRILQNVRQVDTSCYIQGNRSALPLFVAPAAMAKLAHKDGEMAIARACAKTGVIQCVSHE